jgi:hypothetical protein
MLWAGCSKAGDRLALWGEVVYLSSGEQYVTEGAQVRQVGVELLKRAVV